MITNRARLALVLTLAAPLGACSNSPSEAALDPDPDAASVVAEMGKTFELRTGQTARIQGTRIVIGFRGVTSDSRCATDVTCVWEGDAVLRIPASVGGADWMPFDLHTALEPRSASVADHTVTVVGLTPAPRSGERIANERYTVTLRIE